MHSSILHVTDVRRICTVVFTDTLRLYFILHYLLNISGVLLFI